MLRHKETVAPHRRFWLSRASARKRDQCRRVRRERNDLAYRYKCRARAEIQPLCARKPARAERLGHAAEGRYGPPQELRSRAAEECFWRKDCAAALDVL